MNSTGLCNPVWFEKALKSILYLSKNVYKGVLYKEVHKNPGLFFLPKCWVERSFSVTQLLGQM